MDIISCNGAKMYLVIFVFLICVIDTAVVLKVSPDVVDVKSMLSICCVCIYMFG